MLAAPLQGQDAVEPMEVFWQFRHGGVVNTIVDSRYDGMQFFLSLDDVFSSLQLNLQQDPSAGEASGFFVTTDRPFRLDFRNGTAEVEDRSVSIPPDSFLQEELGYFIRPELFDSIFGLRFTLNERQLDLRMESDDEMPIVTTYRRLAGRTNRSFYRPEFVEAPAPLLYDRQRAILGGGVLGYGVGLTFQDGNPRASVNLNGGGEFLGADAQISGFASYLGGATGNAKTLDVRLNSASWRYVADQGPYLRQIRAGRLASTGLRGIGYTGVSLSNEPVQIERFFGSAPFRVETGPEWEVELYLNNQLLDAQRANAAGSYTFQVPITYGTTQVRIVEYGPNGEIEESERQIQIPFTFVPKGQVRYRLDGGYDTDNDRKLLHSTGSIGITRWLTANVGVDLLTAPADTGQAFYGGYGMLSSRVTGPLILSATVAPGELYKVALNAFYASLLSYSIEFTQYGAHRFYNQTRSEHEGRADLSVPFQLGGIPFYLRGSANERKTAIGGYTINVNPELSIQPGAFQLNMGYRSGTSITDGRARATNQLVEGRFGYSFGRGPDANPFFSGLLISMRGAYDLQQNTLQTLSGNLARTISNQARLQLDFSHLPASKVTTLGLGLQLTLPTTRSSTRVQTGSNTSLTVSQDLSGAISYDSGTGSIQFLQQNWVGQAAATLRMFVDADGDGRYDEGETLIEDGGVNFRRSVSTLAGPGNTIIASNLQPYEQYSVEVDQRRISNPLWVPRYQEFSFIADPNRHKLIEIPFYVTGQVEGSALIDRGGELEAVPGLTLHVRSADGTVTLQQNVFSDGDFSFLGLPPGDYEVRVDSTQLSILNAIPEPAVQTFTLQVTENGDFVQGVDFVLRPLEVETPNVPEPAAVAPEPAAVAPEPAAVAPEPVEVAPEPVAVAPEPVEVAPEPVEVAPEPVEVAPEPVDDAPAALPSLGVSPRQPVPTVSGPVVGIELPFPNMFGPGVSAELRARSLQNRFRNELLNGPSPAIERRMLPELCQPLWGAGFVPCE